MGRPKKGSLGIPAYRLHKSSGQGVVTIGGRDKYLGTHGSVESRTKYNQLVGEWMVLGRSDATPHKPETMTIEQLIVAWWSHVEREYSGDSTFPDGCKRALKFLREFCGKSLASEFGPLKFKALRETMVHRESAAKYGKKKKLARSYINKLMNVIRQMFRWGVENELISLELYHGLKSVRKLTPGRSDARETDRVMPARQEDVDAVLPLLPRPMQAMVHLQLLTGMRPGEVCIMRPCDIRMDGPVWHYSPHKHKTKHKGHSRVVRIGPRAQSVLMPWMNATHEPTDYLFKPIDGYIEKRTGRGGTNFVPTYQKTADGTRAFMVIKDRRVNLGACDSSESRDAYNARIARIMDDRKKAAITRHRKHPFKPHYTTCAYGSRVYIVCKRADEVAHAANPEVPSDTPIVQPWHPHQLRHNAATDLRRLYGIDAASVVLGHRSLKVTEIYAEADTKQAEEIMAAVG